LAVKEINGLVNRQVKYVKDVFTLESDFQDFIPEALSFAAFAQQVHIGHELHFDRYFAFSLAFLTSAPFDVKREVRGLKTGKFGTLLLGEQLADFIIYFQVCYRVRPGGLADGILIDIFYGTYQVDVPFDLIVLTGFFAEAPEHLGKGRVEHLGNQR
jgi:hypothetical protein